MKIDSYSLFWICIQAGGIGYLLSFMLNKLNLASLIMLLPMAIFIVGLYLNVKRLKEKELPITIPQIKGET